MNPTRLIMFLELVRGCNNKECPSWGSVCKYGEQKYMTLDVLDKVTQDFRKVLERPHPFEVVDIWTYGCGDSLDHPNLTEMLKLVSENIGHLGKISMAIDSRRNIVQNTEWLQYMHKIKIIHKQPETFDWLERAKYWNQLPIPMSHKLITNRITVDMWEIWKNNAWLKELKAVPWHDIQLGTDSPKFTKRENITFEDGVPNKHGPYPGRPVRRVMINWNGTLRRCLVSPTKHQTLEDLILGEDSICNTCFPLTGGGLAKFYDECVIATPSASCVSDGYFMPRM